MESEKNYTYFRKMYKHTDKSSPLEDVLLLDAINFYGFVPIFAFTQYQNLYIWARKVAPPYASFLHKCWSAEVGL